MGKTTVNNYCTLLKGIVYSGNELKVLAQSQNESALSLLMCHPSISSTNPLGIVITTIIMM